ncbi:MAG: 60S ribosomal protein L31 [Candidatus Thorarchaeota archaeon]|nr:MAG: 60S ribosomal protein L31 [Candidatus Thorarchaeota archaeon]
MSKKKKAEVVEEDLPELEEIGEEEEEFEKEEVEVPDEEEKPDAEEVAPAEVIPEEEIIDERIYTVPLRKAYWTGSRLRRSNRAVRILREFVERHMKPEELLIQPEVNERIWSRGIQKPPRRIRIRATKNSDNLVRVYLAEA